MSKLDQDSIRGCDDNSGRDQEEVTTINIAESRYKKDIRLSAVDYMASFFRDKTLVDGTSIPHVVLFSDDNVSMVMNTRMAKGIDHFYTVFEEEFESSLSPDGQLPSDIAFLMVVHKECARRNIPKQYASGIAIIYLRLCAKLPRKMRKSA